ncbi:MAG: cysteine peptidase family C39 domain-containing protein, partial [Chitinophagales bacterium]
MPLTFPLFKQLDAMDCGATCLRMVAKWYGKTFDGKFLRELSYTGREGVSLAGLSRAAESIGFKTLAVKVDIDTLVTDAPLPCVLHWNQNHFVVLYATNVTNWHKFLGLFKTKEWLAEKQKFQIADPAHGKIKLSFAELKKNWATNDKNEGVALLLETTP